MDDYKILFDLSSSLSQKVQTAQYNASLFEVLSGIDPVKLDGFLYSNEGNLFSSWQQTQNRAQAIEQAHYFFHEAFAHEKFHLTQLLSFFKVNKLFNRVKKNYDLFPIDKIFDDVVWRNMFGKHLQCNDRHRVLDKKFYYTDFTRQAQQSVSCAKKQSYLNTSSYDVVIFPHVSDMRVSAQSKKIICMPDVLSDSLSAHLLGDMQRCHLASHVVCHSSPARDRLLEFFPALETRSYVVPPLLICHDPISQDQSVLNQIMAARMSDMFLTSSQKKTIRDSLKDTAQVDYVLHVGSTGSRKNREAMIHAWEKLNYQYDNPVRLIIVAEPDFFSQMDHGLQLHVKRGNILLLTNVNNRELPLLYSQAKLLLHLSLSGEDVAGILQAIYYQCPVIVADTLDHRWLLEDAALYCDPSSDSLLAQAMIHLLSSMMDRQDLIEKGVKRSQQFLPEQVAKQWCKLFQTVVSAKCGVK